MKKINIEVYLQLQRNGAHTPWSHFDPTQAAPQPCLTRCQNLQRPVHGKSPAPCFLEEAADSTTLRSGQQLAEVPLSLTHHMAFCVFWFSNEIHRSHPTPNSSAPDWKEGSPQWLSTQRHRTQIKIDIISAYMCWFSATCCFISLHMFYISIANLCIIASIWREVMLKQQLRQWQGAGQLVQLTEFQKN